MVRWYAHSTSYKVVEGSRPLGCYTMLTGKYLATFRANVVPLSSATVSKNIVQVTGPYFFQNSRWPAFRRVSSDKCSSYLYYSPFIRRKTDQVRRNNAKQTIGPSLQLRQNRAAVSTFSIPVPSHVCSDGFVSLSLPLLPRFFIFFHSITLRHTPQSVGLLWMGDPVAETSTWQHKHCTRDKKFVPWLGFEPKIPARARPQTYALDRAATGICVCERCSCIFSNPVPSHMFSDSAATLRQMCSAGGDSVPGDRGPP
jgi:hypothetical protein